MLHPLSALRGWGCHDESIPMANETALTWPAEGNARVPYRVFSDPAIYRQELERIFLGPTWQFLALACDLPQPGDYMTTFLGETPVIVTRGADRESTLWSTAAPIAATSSACSGAAMPST